MDEEQPQHTDFAAQKAFLSLPPDQQMLAIWLNGRETNGHVADVMRDVADMKPKVARHETWFIRAIAVLTFLVLIGPAVFFVLGKVWE